MKDGRHEYVVNLHVHTTFSDGTGTIEKVIAAAQAAGLDVLLLTDHDTLEARVKGYEGYHGSLLVLVGYEISGRHNHYLAFGSDHVPEYEWRRPQAFIDWVRDDGGIGFIAHPFEKGSPLSEGGRAYTWEDWSVHGFNGLEIWNHSSSWKARAMTYPRAVLHFFLRTWTLLGPEPETLAKWDDFGKKQRAVGVGGSDCHAFMARLGPFTFCIFPYEFAFRSINTHVLLPGPLSGNLETDQAAVIRALAEGACFVAHDRLHGARGFDFRLENNGGRRAGMGEEMEFKPGDAAAWRLPAPARARLIRDGRVAHTMKGEHGRVQLDAPGVYRLEADWPTRLFGPRPWIFSNPVYVR